jgi:hypothetical protein
MKKLAWIPLKARERGQKSTKCHFSKWGWSFCLVIKILQQSMMFFEFHSFNVSFRIDLLFCSMTIPEPDRYLF